jgi:putative RecB family exonuclease
MKWNLMKIERISASGIKTFKQCEMKFYAVYVLKIPELDVHPAALMGSGSHFMLENSVNARILNDPDIQKHDPMFWKEMAVKKYNVPVAYHKEIDVLIDNAIRWGYFRNINQTVGCELKVQFETPDGTIVTGYIDRLDVNAPDADIIDIKTQKNAFEDDELKENWQAKIYNIGARLIHPEITRNAKVSFWVLRHQVQRVLLTAQDALDDMVNLQSMVDKIKACDKPEVCSSGLCKWCPYESQCPASKENARDRFKRMKQ